MLKNRHAFPPGGFAFYEPRTNWNSTPGFDFDQVVKQIITMRLKNPRWESEWSTDPKAVGDELDAYTCLRIKNNPNYCLGEVTAEELKKNSMLRSQQDHGGVGAAAGRVVERVENATAGVGVILDWLGDSLEPVKPALAERRASVCVKCEHNGRPDFIQRIEGWAASGIKELINVAKDLELATTHDANLHHCQPCDCALKLKVWCKMDHILAHTNDRVMSSLPEWCWIKLKDQ